MQTICKACGKNVTTRDDPQVCTPCFLEGWGRKPWMKVESTDPHKEEFLQEPSEDAPLYVPDRNKGGR